MNKKLLALGLGAAMMMGMAVSASAEEKTVINFYEHSDREKIATDLVEADRYRNGDETNFSQYVLEGQVIRIRLNPVTGMEA